MLILQEVERSLQLRGTARTPGAVLSGNQTLFGCSTSFLTHSTPPENSSAQYSIGRAQNLHTL